MAKRSQSEHHHNGLFLSSPFWPAVLYHLQILTRPLWRSSNPQVSPCLMTQKTGCFVDMVRHRGRRSPTFFYFLNIVCFFIFLYFPCFLPGHCLHEIFALREGKVGRVPDMVVWPSECISCVISMFLLVCFSPPTQHQWSPRLRWFKGLISAEAGLLICMSGDLIRNVRGRMVDTQYSTVWLGTVHPWIMISRLVFCCYGWHYFIKQMSVDGWLKLD